MQGIGHAKAACRAEPNRARRLLRYAQNPVIEQGIFARIDGDGIIHDVGAAVPIFNAHVAVEVVGLLELKNVDAVCRDDEIVRAGKPVGAPLKRHRRAGAIEIHMVVESRTVSPRHRLDEIEALDIVPPRIAAGSFGNPILNALLNRYPEDFREDLVDL